MSKHGFLRRFKADVAAIVVYVLMASLYGNILLWFSIDGAWLSVALILAISPSIHTRRYILGEKSGSA